MRQYKADFYDNHEGQLCRSGIFGESDEDGAKKDGSEYGSEIPVPVLTVLNIQA